MNKENILRLLSETVHPETGRDIVSSGMVENVTTGDDKITVTLLFARSRDPFATSIKRQVTQKLAEKYPQAAGNITVIIKEQAPDTAPRKKNPADTSTATEIRNIIAVASGKGGVGKSTVTANLATTLAAMGYRVGVLDADIYGPSQPKMFGVEGYLPDAVEKDGNDYIVPAENYGVKIMSIGFFIKDSDALVWRGPMANNALRQLIHQTLWGELDFLLIDMPPGTGDVHLGVMSELKLTGAVIVSTPQQVALADVLRGINMFRAPKIEVPVIGIVENMAWFTPAELPDNRYYIFGRGGVARMAEKEGLEVLGQIPIIQSVMDGGESGRPASVTDSLAAPYYRQTAETIVEKTMKSC